MYFSSLSAYVDRLSSQWTGWEILSSVLAKIPLSNEYLSWDFKESHQWITVIFYIHLKSSVLFNKRHQNRKSITTKDLGWRHEDVLLGHSTPEETYNEGIPRPNFLLDLFSLDVYVNKSFYDVKFYVIPTNMFLFLHNNEFIIGIKIKIWFYTSFSNLNKHTILSYLLVINWYTILLVWY